MLRENLAKFVQAAEVSCSFLSWLVQLHNPPRSSNGVRRKF